MWSGTWCYIKVCWFINGTASDSRLSGKNWGEKITIETRISHVLNEQGTGYDFLKSIGVRSESYHVKEYPRLIQTLKSELD